MVRVYLGAVIPFLVKIFFFAKHSLIIFSIFVFPYILNGATAIDDYSHKGWPTRETCFAKKQEIIGYLFSVWSFTDNFVSYEIMEWSGYATVNTIAFSEGVQRVVLRCIFKK